MKKVCVVGSMNLDIVLNVKNLPKKGETFFVDTMEKIPGGKGANQAVAAKRLGCDVHMISQIGDDDNGELLQSYLQKDGIHTQYVFKDKTQPTGTAIITVDENGDNTIAVISGANMTLKARSIMKAKEIIESCDIVIAQFETPMNVTKEVFQIAKKSNAITILNPAPASKMQEDLLKVTDIIVPNETEVLELTGLEVSDLDSAKKSAEIFFEKGVSYVIVTLGEKGAALVSREEAELIKAYKVDAIDTTAAGDSFIGGVASQLSQNKEINFAIIKEAVRFGNKVSSITVTKKGAQISLPSLEEVNEKYAEE
ncbi:ribokinase [Vallitalea okinawensis]|uniref:ribokinase n=1 Tax=Vallitalea okinawensis TaxID=2078660 RepID=UPI000CFCFF42|nr:ribokinase [Vallitalea okinawensis]